jgi:hypothetical protein
MRLWTGIASEDKCFTGEMTLTTVVVGNIASTSGMANLFGVN